MRKTERECRTCGIKYPMRGGQLICRDCTAAGVRPIFGAAFTPCTNVAVSGARDFECKGGYMLRDAVEMFEAARQCFEWAGIPYMLENPIGVLSSIPHIGKPDHYFHPWEYTTPEMST